MAFVVEDGTAKADANSYVAVADADAYFALLNDTDWKALGDVAKQAALVRATEYVDSKFQFVGARVSSSQALAWPRTGAADAYEGFDIGSTQIPVSLKKVVMAMAKVSSGGVDLAAPLDRGGKITSESVGPISVSYAQDADPETSYPITRLMRGIVVSDNLVSWAMPQGGDEYATEDRTFKAGMFNNTGTE